MFQIKGPLPTEPSKFVVGLTNAGRPAFPAHTKRSPFTAKEWARLKNLWESFAGKVADPNRFCLCLPLGEEQYGVIHYEAGKKLRVTLDDDVSIQQFEDLFPPVEAAAAIKADKRIRPNQPCPCGRKKLNGRPIKYKKCCGAYV